MAAETTNAFQQGGLARLASHGRLPCLWCDPTGWQRARRCPKLLKRNRVGDMFTLYMLCQLLVQSARIYHISGLCGGYFYGWRVAVSQAH